jgi:predicted DNA-binding WGR domain protein
MGYLTLSISNRDREANGPILFGVRGWGLIGTCGKHRIELFENSAEARVAMAALAACKARRGYHTSKLSHRYRASGNFLVPDRWPRITR